MLMLSKQLNLRASILDSWDRDDQLVPAESDWCTLVQSRSKGSGGLGLEGFPLWPGDG